MFSPSPSGTKINRINVLVNIYHGTNKYIKKRMILCRYVYEPNVHELFVNLFGVKLGSRLNERT
ncbi:hypothetical protein HanRHA438_Chr07g0303371 [Helianthus annuus]|nr:hypothetical protein HanIR_Chr07g0315951 [Helianthus annuus]KAJ0907812.1 hypothetical protein HanRHA438_Chr07g0303371 [Helianthus annuus]